MADILALVALTLVKLGRAKSLKYVLPYWATGCELAQLNISVSPTLNQPSRAKSLKYICHVLLWL